MRGLRLRGRTRHDPPHATAREARAMTPPRDHDVAESLAQGAGHG